jgi:hypothetical protein
MKKRLYGALATYSLLICLSLFSLTGNVRLMTLIFLGGLMLKTYLHYLANS